MRASPRPPSAHAAPLLTLPSFAGVCMTGPTRRRPIIELCVPSALDPTLAPPGQHVVSLFVQYAPYKLASGTWTDGVLKNEFADHGARSRCSRRGPPLSVARDHAHACAHGGVVPCSPPVRLPTPVFRIIDQYAPNFSASVIGRDVLSAWDLENILGLTGGVRTGQPWASASTAEGPGGRR